MNQTRQSSKRSFTVEMALWILVAVVALALRLVRLDAAPLNGREAREAILVWRAVTGQGMPETGYSPLLFTANALLFALCGTSDRLARLWPVLCGSTLTLTPFLFRRRIGRVGALATGLCLAFSPTLLFASRQLDGTIVAVLAGTVFLGGLVSFFDTSIGKDGQDTGNRTWLTLVAGGLGLAVSSSSSAYGLLLAFGIAWLSLVWAWPDGDVRRLWALLRSHLNYVLVVFLLASLAFVTALGWNLAGIGATGDLLSAWIARFGPASNPVASPLTLMAVYELFVLAFGIGGLVWAIRHSHRFGVLLGMWAGVGILLLFLMPGRTELDILWVVLPLTMLTGIAIEQLGSSLQQQGDWLSEGLHIPVVVLLWVHFYLMLARYAISSNPAAQNTSLALALLTVVLQGLLTMIFALALRFGAALRSAAVGTGIALVVLTFSAGWGVAYVRPSDPRELLVHQPTSVEVHDLVQTLRDLSWRKTGLPLALSFALDADPDSVLTWYLRDFTAKEGFDSEAGLPSVLVTVQTDLEILNVSDNYVGQDLALRRSWDFNDAACVREESLPDSSELPIISLPQCRSLVGWWLFRNTPTIPAVEQRVALWLKKEQ